MCGYIGNVYDHPEVQALLRQLEIDIPYPLGQQYVMQIHPGHIAAAGRGYEMNPAIWWYAMKRQRQTLVPNGDITSFNARNVDLGMWREPINKRRGVVIATEIGESQDGHHYLMRAHKPLAIGTVWQECEAEEGPVRSFALITRPAHPDFARYHSKAMPLFLPLQVESLRTWLDPNIPASDPAIRYYLNNPQITSDMDVMPVTTFIRAEAAGEAEIMHAST